MKVRITENIEPRFTGYHLRGKVVDVVDYVGDYDYLQHTDKEGKRYVFHKNQVEEIFEPQSGMIFETSSGGYGFFVAMPNGGLTMLHVSHLEGTFSSSRITGHDSFDYTRFMEKIKQDGNTYITKIFLPIDDRGVNLKKCYNEDYRGPLVWESPNVVKELTLQEVADKFNIPVDRLRIKE
jgi:hypothetical protein